MIKHARVLALIAVTILVVMSWNVSAQDQPTTTVTDDDVNAIAHELYCPVCENITLDVCGTAACADWRDEIRMQLEAGRTKEQITDDFVQRFGDRVVGTPQDSVLRALSLVTPWVIIAAVLVLVGSMVMGSQRRRNKPLAAVQPPDDRSIDRYQKLLEEDLEG
ncbi:MAG: cytochrome c-type biogenesis protein CcmH [Anaerolineae bacterium]